MNAQDVSTVQRSPRAVGGDPVPGSGSVPAAAALPTGGVVVGVDNSTSAVRTALWAARHAVQQHVPLTIVHCSAPEADHPLGELMGIAGRVRSVLPGVRAHFEVRSGDPVEILTEMSRGATLMVVGTADADALDPDGSVPVRLITRSHAPVAVVAAGGRSDGPVLVGVDGSRRSLAALQYAALQAQHRGVDLIVLMAWVEVVLDERAGGLLVVQDWRVETSRWEQELNRLVSGLRAEFPSIGISGELVHQRAAGALVDRAVGCCEVVVGRRGSGRVHSLAAGSTSRALVAAAAGVVIVLPDLSRPTG